MEGQVLSRLLAVITALTFLVSADVADFLTTVADCCKYCGEPTRALLTTRTTFLWYSCVSLLIRHTTNGLVE